MRTHPVPTHLHVEDRLVAGLTVRQALPVALGACGGYGLWQHALLPPVPRLVLAVLAALAGLAVALSRPDGQPLLRWLLLVGSHALTPRRAVWQRAGASLPPPPAAPARGGRPRRGAHPAPYRRRRPPAPRQARGRGGSHP